MKKNNKIKFLIFLLMIVILTGCGAKDNNKNEILEDNNIGQLAVDTSNEYELLKNIEKQIRTKTDFIPKVAIVLGSGLNNFVENIEIVSSVSYKDIKGLPISTAPGHEGKFVFGYIEKVPVVIMQGRVHCYEGYTSMQVVRPIRVMKMLGANILLLTNSSGGVNADFESGEIMMITNQILYGVENPLIGKNIDALGERFADMSNIYDKELQVLIREAAKEANVELEEGVYLQDTGPSYETAAETKMFRMFGADAVGMSTGIEAIAGNHMGMKVGGISCVTAPPADVSTTILNDEVVNAKAETMVKNLSEIIKMFVKKLEVQ